MASIARENLEENLYMPRPQARVLGDGGRTVQISSMAEQRGVAFHADFWASQEVMIGFVKS